METGEVLTLILGGGAVATIGAFFSGIKSLQSGARAREKETVTDLVKQRKEAWSDRDFANDERAYWMKWAATVEYHALQAGVSLPPRPPEPERDPEESKSVH